MIRLFISVFLFSTAYVHCADHDTFKNCSRIEFCKTLRSLKLKPEEQFAADVDNAWFVKNVNMVSLSNGNNEELILEITMLEDHRVKITVRENNSDRFKIPYVLSEEPKISVIVKGQAYNIATVVSMDDRDEYVVIEKGPPFTLWFYRNRKYIAQFSAERLVMQNTNTSKSFTFDFTFSTAKALYGLSHHAFNMILPKTVDGSMDPIRLRNSDISYYEINDTLGLYGSIPVLYGHSENWTSGIFLHNAAEQWVDINYTTNTASAYFMVESGALEFFVMLGPTPEDVVKQYTSLTGVAHMPQIWVLGYHQCRWSYWTQDEAKDVVANMDNNDFPMDVLWLDDGHTNQNRYFEWNPENFTDPIEMQKNISASGRRIVTILDPHIKVADDYAVYAGAKGKYFVKWANGSDFQGDCWPGLSSWIDFLDPEASDYYGSWYRYDRFNKSTPTLAGAWNDMNEPSVFDDSLEKTFPFELVHYGGVEHRNIHNMYGLLQVRSTHQGLLNRDNNTLRPFILTRSHFAGSQRYAAIWTGDNKAEWPYIRLSYSECMTANLLGQVLCGADVAGFFDERPKPDTELTERWYQAAIWLPFFRGHSEKTTARREPYLFPEDTQKIIRRALKLRYKHIPVFYTLFASHTLYGAPIIRPLFYHYPSMLGYDDHLLLGSDILVRPVFESKAKEVIVSFPGTSSDLWYRVDHESWNYYPGGEDQKFAVNSSDSPFFYRGGSIICRWEREKRSTTNMIEDPYTVFVNVDNNKAASGELYADDFYSFNYQDEKTYFYARLDYIPETRGLIITQISGEPTGINVFFQSVVVHSPDDGGKRVYSHHTTTADGTPLENINIASRLRQREGSFVLYF